MTAIDYPMTFDYGETSPPYGTPANPYHRGQDYYMPDNTPIVINGNTTIGFSGHSGWVFGSHLHIGKFINGKDVNPQGQGFTLKAPARVTQVGEDAINGKFVAINDADGVRFVYLHMSAQTATVNQIIKEGEDPNVIAQLQQQIIDMQAQIDIMRPDLVDSHNRIDGLVAEITAERASYEDRIAGLEKQLSDKQATTKAAIAKAQVTAPAATKSKYFTTLAKALLGQL